MSTPASLLPTIQGTPVWLTWKDWESLALRLSGIPKEANTYDLFRAFSPHGSIFNIDIFDDRHGNRGNFGRIRYRYVLLPAWAAANRFINTSLPRESC